MRNATPVTSAILLFCAAGTVALLACGGDVKPAGADAGEVDGGSVDAGARDAGRDAAEVDASSCPDEDSDDHGAPPCGDDCDDADPTRYPGATEVCDLDDEDCNDSTYGADMDTDGFESSLCCNGVGNCGGDCDDAVNTVNPGAAEVCNSGVDDDCDGSADEGVTTPFYADCDGDGYGGGTPVEQCVAPATAPPACPTRLWTTVGGDCDECRVDVRPGAPEPCDGIDNDCDGRVDTGVTCGRAFDPSGAWPLPAAVSLTCGSLGGGSAVDFAFSSLTFAHSGTMLTVTGGGIYCPMTAVSARASRMVNVSCTLPGGCSETYSLTGTFTDDTHFTGTFHAVFVGASGSFDCLGCTNTDIPVTATLAGCR